MITITIDPQHLKKRALHQPQVEAAILAAVEAVPDFRCLTLELGMEVVFEADRFDCEGTDEITGAQLLTLVNRVLDDLQSA